MRTLDAAAAVAEHQLGLVTRQQLLAAGVKPDTADEAVRTGRLLRQERNVYRVPGSPDAPKVRLLAKVLALGDGAVLSHATAAWLWGLTDPPHEHHATVPAWSATTVHRPGRPRVERPAPRSCRHGRWSPGHGRGPHDPGLRRRPHDRRRAARRRSTSPARHLTDAAAGDRAGPRPSRSRRCRQVASAVGDGRAAGVRLRAALLPLAGSTAGRRLDPAPPHRRTGLRTGGAGPRVARAAGRPRAGRCRPPRPQTRPRPGHGSPERCSWPMGGSSCASPTGGGCRNRHRSSPRSTRSCERSQHDGRRCPQHRCSR